jgi:threonylcarbamoyladenosine tRNA methylthiotransferase MtaB
MTKNRIRIGFGTLGCKLNFAETSFFQEQLPEAFVVVPFASPADVYVINTCTVTESADKKGRNMISRAHRMNPGAVIIVMGCQSQVAADAMAGLPGVSVVLGNHEKFSLRHYLEQFAKSEPEKGIHVTARERMEAFFPSVSYSGRTRCFIKVQDGCDHFCAYCMVPFARGKSRNASVADVVEMIRASEKRGVREIVLTGVNIGDFGKSTGETFTALLKEILQSTSVPRIRLGSVEPELLTTGIIGLVASEARLMPHFHIPLQSGCDTTLRAMKRKYDTRLVTGLLREIQDKVPGAFTGADIIAGFPGESEQDFKETFDFVSKSGFSSLHVFPYSLRTGTAAAGMTGQVAHQVKQERKKMLIELSGKLKKTFFTQNIGKVRNILIERINSGGMAQGFSENYIPVVTEADASASRNSIVKVRLTGITEDEKMKGEIEL